VQRHGGGLEPLLREQSAASAPAGPDSPVSPHVD
jgi:hypothetical protein